MYLKEYFPFYTTYANPLLYEGERMQDKEFNLMKSCGHTRFLDDRALDFINKFNNRIFVLDATQYGINELGEVAEYLEPMFYNNVIGVFNNLLADARKHPLTTRRYMWKFKY